MVRTTHHPPTHQWEMVREEGLVSAGWAATDLAARPGINPGEPQLLLEEKTPVTPDFARRLSVAPGTAEGLWLNPQRTWDDLHATVSRQRLSQLDADPWRVVLWPNGKGKLPAKARAALAAHPEVGDG